MKVILNKYGESLQLDVVLAEGSVSLREPLVVIGRHSCTGQMTLQSVAPNWVALVCHSCNFRKLVPISICQNNSTFSRFFADIVEKTKGNVPKRTFVKI